MRVLKIIQANPEVFDLGTNIHYTEAEAIRLVASMQCKGNKIQNEKFDVRQTHTAICNLMSIGFYSTAVEMAIDLIPRAELTRQFYIAQDLCYRLIAHFYHENDVESAHIYRSLHDKYAMNTSYENENLVLCNEAILNYKTLNELDLINVEELNVLLETIEKNLPFDTTWYHYYHFHCKSIIVDDKELELLYLSAIAYFENLPHKHSYFSETFLARLILFYLDSSDLKKAELKLNELEAGSIIWFESYLAYTNNLLDKNDLKSNDVCSLVMNHSKYITLDTALKTKWKVAYKASVKLLLDS